MTGPAAGPATSSTEQQPNILLIMTDQLSAPFLSIHGGPAITPNIDRLAAEGTTFTSAYSNSPLCAPVRFAMMSGLAADPEHANVAAAFAAEAAERWDAPAIDAAVRSNQEARATVDRALRQGRFEAWDYVPESNALNQYMRNHLDLNDVESSRRA